MHISLIWAMAKNRVIGRDNALPWHLPKDLRHFMATTKGKPCIMGRKTFESMTAPLAGRTNIVLTNDRSWHAEGIKIAYDFDEAIAMAQDQCKADGQDELMVVGGANIYAMALPRATRLYVTQVQLCPQGDVFFPPLGLELWTLVDRKEIHADERHKAAFTICRYER
jgi:dihydrofolate reductase